MKIVPHYSAAVAALIVLLAATMTVPVWAQEEAAEPRAAAFRVVKAVPGEPGQPEVILPDGYGLFEGERHNVASRAEFYAFVRGPENNEGVPVTIRWPGEAIHAVIGSNRRLELGRDADDPDAVTFTLPVTAPAPVNDQGTLQVWSHYNEPGLRYRIEHNDPDRVAGPWTGVPWPSNQTRAAIHYLVASEAILRDSGAIEAAAEKGHFWAIMGFETNNTLHTDNPPHWHLAYISGRTWASPTYLPHYWINAEGRTFYNGMDVTGQGRQQLRAGDPGPMHDGDGNLVLTTTIREDGGLDIEAPEGSLYEIVPGTDGDFVRGLGVRRGREPWLLIQTLDDVTAGVLSIRVQDVQEPSNSRTEVHLYDRLTGEVLEVLEHPLEAGAASAGGNGE